MRVTCSNPSLEDGRELQYIKKLNGNDSHFGRDFLFKFTATPELAVRSDSSSKAAEAAADAGQPSPGPFTLTGPPPSLGPPHHLPPPGASFSQRLGTYFTLG